MALCRLYRATDRHNGVNAKGKGMRLYRHLYIQVLIGIGLGVIFGALWPDFGVALKPVGDAFVRLIRMLVTPIIFCTVAGGIARISDIRRVGRIGGRALLYFEVVSTLALLIGLICAAIIKPGHGFDVSIASLNSATVVDYAIKAKQAGGFWAMVFNIVPETFFSPFANGEPLQVLLLAVLTGFAMAGLEARGVTVTAPLEKLGMVFFAIVRIVVKAAPVGAFGAIAFTVGRYGLTALLHLGALVLTVYLASAIFIVVVLGLIARQTGFSLWRLLVYLREELFIVLGASSSETVLPQLMTKLENLGAEKTVVGLVVPSGYSFNLDGTNIYITAAVLFLAQATNTHLTIGQIAMLMGVAMITSKGASGVTGAGFVTLAVTLGTLGTIPVTAMALIIGVDRFMSESRALTNVIGNSVATLVVAHWEGKLDHERLQATLR